jgi:hypothetical protein
MGKGRMKKIPPRKDEFSLKQNHGMKILLCLQEKVVESFLIIFVEISL